MKLRPKSRGFADWFRHADRAIHTGALILLANGRRYSIESKPKVVDECGRKHMGLADHGVLAASAHVVAVSGHDRETRSGKWFEQTSIAKAVPKREGRT